MTCPEVLIDHKATNKHFGLSEKGCPFSRVNCFSNHLHPRSKFYHQQGHEPGHLLVVEADGLSAGAQFER